MTSYLQRMALSAMKPGAATLRPMVGSIYSPPKSRVASEPILMEQDILSPKPDELNARPVFDSRPLSTAPHPTLNAPSDTVAAPREKYPRPRHPPPIVEGDEHKPRSSPAQADPAPRNLRFQVAAGVRRDSKRVEPLPLRGEAILPEASEVSKDESGKMRAVNNNRRENGGDIERPFVPIVAESFQSPPPLKGSSDRFDSAPRLGGKRERTAAAREPDEIQIHIGRIEVMAVQPPPLRPAPQKAVRKAPSLAEYLKRRNGGIP